MARCCRSGTAVENRFPGGLTRGGAALNRGGRRPRRRRPGQSTARPLNAARVVSVGSYDAGSYGALAEPVIDACAEPPGPLPGFKPVSSYLYDIAADDDTKFPGVVKYASHRGFFTTRVAFKPPWQTVRFALPGNSERVHRTAAPRPGGGHPSRGPHDDSLATKINHFYNGIGVLAIRPYWGLLHASLVGELLVEGEYRPLAVAGRASGSLPGHAPSRSRSLPSRASRRSNA